MSRNVLQRLLMFMFDQVSWKPVFDSRLRCMIASEEIVLAIALFRR